jgi:hypothetical protein
MFASLALSSWVSFKDVEEAGSEESPKLDYYETWGRKKHRQACWITFIQLAILKEENDK